MVCEICGASRVSALFKISENRKILFCEDCGVRFVSPWSVPAEIYKSGYFAAWGVCQGQRELYSRKLKELTYEAVFKEAEKFINPGELLDVGSAFGYSFPAARKRGWDFRGVEISCEAYSHMDKALASRVALGDFSEMNMKCGFFDLVTMVDFIEHIARPKDVLRKAFHILKPEGVIAVVTPDPNSFSSKFMGKKWPHIKPEHAFYFSPKALKALFESSGFQPLIFKPFWKATNFFYAAGQVEVYGPAYAAGIFKLLRAVLPDRLLGANIFLPQGEVLALAKKP